MCKSVRFTALAALFCVAVSTAWAAPPAGQKNAPGTIVIVFKDGHRQSFSLSEIDRVEFGAGSGYTAQNEGPSSGQPSRGHFLGKWEVGDGHGRTFYITLNEDGGAYRSLGDVHGRWTYVEGEARITWSDGAQDAIRKVGSRYQKFAYSAGKLFTDDPDNVTGARNLMPPPV
ncbi:MAG TPA: hypothetical protein VL991_14400 [Terracidiphilus sp.]|nr:hypothetical protein [Terracidiphilus sp.]